jgi:hypothetical protein
MANTTDKDQQLLTDIFNALAGTAENPLEVADRTEKKADELDLLFKTWCTDVYQDRIVPYLYGCAAAIRQTVTGEGDWLGFSCSGGNAICIANPGVHDRTSPLLNMDGRFDSFDMDANEVSLLLLEPDATGVIGIKGLYATHQPTEEESLIVNHLKQDYATGTPFEKIGPDLRAYVANWLLRDHDVTLKYEMSEATPHLTFDSAMPWSSQQ